MSKKRVLEHGMQRRGFVTVDDEATKGATIGENLYNSNGSLYNPYNLIEEIVEEVAESQPSFMATIWRLILEIPANIVSLAALTEVGFAARISATSEWANRTITGTFGRIKITDGDGVESQLNVTLNSGGDVTLNTGGNVTLNTLTSGDPIIDLGPWPTVQNSIDAGLVYEIHFGDQLIVYDSFDVIGTLYIKGDLVIL